MCKYCVLGCNVHYTCYICDVSFKHNQLESAATPPSFGEMVLKHVHDNGKSGWKTCTKGAFERGSIETVSQHNLLVELQGSFSTCDEIIVKGKKAQKQPKPPPPPLCLDWYISRTKLNKCEHLQLHDDWTISLCWWNSRKATKPEEVRLFLYFNVSKTFLAWRSGDNKYSNLTGL